MVQLTSSFQKTKNNKLLINKLIGCFLGFDPWRLLKKNIDLIKRMKRHFLGSYPLVQINFPFLLLLLLLFLMYEFINSFLCLVCPLFGLRFSKSTLILKLKQAPSSEENQ
ncbi:hypothetical protein TorRG33x02_318320 [Trema orientale]|uniref:Transmembrane protein n=1 Tax=Trema orientale TaxID=63057 RepID=A0A2P5BKB8_TREOI|nr:hypothetical protein TorRG33x02_318320 [Trema orientale]